MDADTLIADFFAAVRRAFDVDGEAFQVADMDWLTDAETEKLDEDAE